MNVDMILEDRLAGGRRDRPVELIQCRCGRECGAATWDGSAWWSGGGMVGESPSAPDKRTSCPVCDPRRWVMRKRELVKTAAGDWVFMDTWRSDGSDGAAVRNAAAPAERKPKPNKVVSDV